MEHSVPVPQLTMAAWLRFDAIRRCLAIARPRRVLEVGTGQGGFGAWLAARYEYVGFEPDPSSRAVATERIGTQPRARIVERLDDFDAQPCDLLCAFEVIEHIDDDGAAIDEWRRFLAPRGHILLSTPAHSAHYGVADEYVGHFRRYDRDELRALLEKHGFTIVCFTSYGAGLGQALETTRNIVLKRRGPTTKEAGSALSGRLFQPQRPAAMWTNYLVTLPFRVLQRPFAPTDIGSGYVVLARRNT